MTAPNPPQARNVTVTAEVISSATGTSAASDEALRKRLPEYGAQIADGFTDWLASPQPPRDPQRVRIVKVVLTRTYVIGQAVIELAEPVQAFA